MSKGLTRQEILEKLPDLRPGSFDLFCARAGVVWSEKRPNKVVPHLTEFVYPADSVDKIKSVMLRGRKLSDHLIRSKIQTGRK